MKRLLVLVFFILLLFFLFPKNARAEVLLWDDFNDGNANDGIPVDWEEFRGPEGDWLIENGEYIGTVVKECGLDIFSYAIAGNPSWSDYSFSIKIMGTEGVDKKIMFRYQSENTRYDLNFIDGTIVGLQKWINESSVAIWWGSFNTVNNRWYSIKVETINENIKVFIDDQKIIDIIDENDPILAGKIGLQVWPGFYQGCGGKTTTRFDDVLVTSLEPTPVQPLILLPGLGGSWNYEAIILGIEKESEDWYLTPGVRVYDGLIQTLQNAGYVVSENLFIFTYDWTKPVNFIANDLKNYVANVVDPPPGTNIDLIGHCLGGKVARTYVQNNPNDHFVDQLIALGTPHKGTPKVYYLWEGADLNKTLSYWQRIGAGILLQLRKKAYENNVEAIQTIFPGLKDLLPTFSYLKRYNQEISIEKMRERNEWLENLNNTIPSQLLNIFNTFTGTSFDTLKWIHVQNQNHFDKFLERWTDGKPTGKEEFAPGDKTVLVESTQLEGTNVIKLENIDHRGLVADFEGQEAIINFLGLSPTEIVLVQNILHEPMIIFQIASSAALKVIDPLNRKIGFEIPSSEIPNGIYSSQDKLIIVPNAIAGQYQAIVKKENGGGEYRLLVGQLTSPKDIWFEFQGDSSQQITEIFTINFDPSLFQTKKDLLFLAKQKFEELKIDVESKLPKPIIRIFLNSLDMEIRQIEKILNFLEEEKNDQGNWGMMAMIYNFDRLKKQLKTWQKLSKISSEDETFFREEFREIEDLVIQAYEI